MSSLKSYIQRTGYLSMNPYELHKHLINTYVLNKKGATKLFVRDTSRDKTDADVIKENHRFLWDDDDIPLTWEERLAKKYYDKLFKEFCITDLSRFKENKFAMRWQTEQELISGKGQFICGSRGCTISDPLRTWEVNFLYEELGKKKNALVKLRLCSECSVKLNYKNKRKEIKRLKNKKSNEDSRTNSSKNEILSEGESSKTTLKEKENVTEEKEDKTDDIEGNDIWNAPLENIEQPSRDEEFEKYLEHLLL